MPRMVAYPLEDIIKRMEAPNGRSATSNRVLVVDNQGIMGAGLEKLLAGDQALEVSGITTRNELILVQEIQRLQPDTIILVLESEIISPCRLLELLQYYGRFRIIMVSINSNNIEVYDRQEIVACNQDSLLTKLKLE